MAKTKTREQELLKGALARLHLPVLVTGFPVGMAGLYYVLQTTRIPPEAARAVTFRSGS